MLYRKVFLVQECYKRRNREKIKILGIWHNSHSKAGKEYISSKGKPYELCSIKDDKGYLSGFGNQTTKAWKIGDEIEVEVEINGQDRNFKLIDQRVTRQEFDLLKHDIKFCKDEIGYLHKKFEGLDLKNKVEEIEDTDLDESPDNYGDAI